MIRAAEPRSGPTVAVGGVREGIRSKLFPRTRKSSTFHVSLREDGLQGVKGLDFITLRAKLSGAVYCYRSCLWACLQRAGGVRTLLQPARAQCLRLSERFFSILKKRLLASLLSTVYACVWFKSANLGMWITTFISFNCQLLEYTN